MRTYYPLMPPGWKPDVEHDHMLEQAREIEGFISPSEHPTPTERIWVTKDGRRIFVGKMTNDHLYNTINLLHRWGKQTQVAAILALNQSLVHLQGEMAVLECEQALDRMYEMTVEEFIEREVPTWDRLLEEAEKRGIKIPGLVPRWS